MKTAAAVMVFLVLLVSNLRGEIDFRVVHEFDGVNGDSPYGHLISVDGRLYGMTAGDTVGNTGVIFSLDPDGSGYTVLRHFQGRPVDGAWPHGSLFFFNGLLYGMTWAGGCDENNCPNLDETGCGTIFSLQTDGAGYQVLWTFACGGGDLYASLPNSHFISDGRRLYGTTSEGGPGDGGTVFAFDPAGDGPEILHGFNAFTAADGKQPGGGLVLKDGTLYGTTVAGGQTDLGIIFSIRTDGSDFTILHDFTGPDGSSSFSSPILAGGRLFGTTLRGGDFGQGVVFSLKTDGSDFRVLHHFDGVDGASAFEGVVLAGETLYGVTVANGPVDFGVIYSLRTDGSDFRVLHRFDWTDGSWVDGRLLLLGGRFYGLASYGGTSDPTHGLVFSFLRPVPEGLPVIQSGDYNGDGRAEIAVFRPESGLWAVRGLGRLYFGGPGDIPVSGDYDGDGYADVGIFRPAAGLWAVKNVTRLYFGGSDDLPVPADYDGDGRADIAIFQPRTGRWAIRGVTSFYFGALGDIPAPGDCDGDGASEAAVFRPATGLWAVRGLTRLYFGTLGDRPLPAVYRWYGDGSPFRTEIGIFRPATGLWALRGSSRFYFGGKGDVPFRGDFTDNSLDETGIFRPAAGLWAVKGVTRAYFGREEDIPATR